MEEDLRQAINQLGAEFRKEASDLALKIERAKGASDIMKSRFDSEVGHLRREVGEALDKLDGVNDLSLRMVGAEAKLDAATKKIDDAVDKLHKNDCSERLTALEARNSEKEKADDKKTQNARAVWVLLGGTYVKIAWDSLAHWLKTGPHSG